MKRKMPIFVTMISEMRRLQVFDLRYEPDLQTVMILLLTVFGLLRISEALKLNWVDVKEDRMLIRGTSNTSAWREMVTLTLWKTKTTTGENCLRICSVVCDRRDPGGINEACWDSVAMLKHWRERRTSADESRRAKRVFTITRDDYNKNLKRALREIGIESEKYGTHSGRIGGATMLWEAGATDGEIMEMGRWRSDCWKNLLQASQIEMPKVVKNAKRIKR